MVANATFQFKTYLVAGLLLLLFASVNFAMITYTNYSANLAKDSGNNTVTINVSSVDSVYANKTITAIPPLYSVNANFTTNISNASEVFVFFVIKANSSAYTGNIIIQINNGSGSVTQYNQSINTSTILSDTTYSVNITNITNFSLASRNVSVGLYNLNPTPTVAIPIKVSINAILLQTTVVSAGALSVTINRPTNTTYTAADHEVNVTCSGDNASYLMNVTLRGFTVLSNQAMTNGTSYQTTMAFNDNGGKQLNATCWNNTYQNTSSSVYFTQSNSVTATQNSPTNTTYSDSSSVYLNTTCSGSHLSYLLNVTLDGSNNVTSQAVTNGSSYQTSVSLSNAGHSTSSVCWNNSVSGTSSTTYFTVNYIFVETSLNSTTLDFGSVEQNTNDNPGGAFLFTSTSNSNTAVDVYLNATNLVYSSNSIPSTDIKVSTDNVPANGKQFNAANWINGTSANNGFYENLAVGSSFTMNFWLNVPAGQAAGGYSGTVNIKAVADGNTP